MDTKARLHFYPATGYSPARGVIIGIGAGILMWAVIITLIVLPIVL